jgi:hypothetical protein
VAVSPEKRYFGFFPALRLRTNLDLGDWIVGTPPDGTPWASGRFEELSRMLVASYAPKGFEGCAMLWHRERGFDGVLPADADIGAILASVTFAVLDANDRLRLHEKDRWNKARYLATTENPDLFIQPISEDGGIAHRRGGLLRRTLLGGLKIGGEPPPLPDATEPIDEPVPASTKLARALYDRIASGVGDGPAIATAADWHRRALVNSSAVTWEHRLVTLKVGFEALFHGVKSRGCAKRLRHLFETVTAAHRDLLPWVGLLWTPTERTLQRSFKGKPDPRSELEDWFMTLADARNQIIHDGVLKTGVYVLSERPLTRYAGALFLTGERVLREAIKAKLGAEVLLCGALRRRAFGEAAFGELADQLIEAAKALPTPPPKPPGRAPRTVEAMLADLHCVDARLVVVGTAGHVFEDYTHEASANDGNNQMAITEAEFEALRAAGAEDELPDRWWPCE